MSLANCLSQISKISATTFCRTLSTSSIVKSSERFGNDSGESGWVWGKDGVGCGGKTADVATEIKPSVGKDKEYKSPEYFGYDDMSFYDIEKSVVDQRVPQPKSGLTEYWWYKSIVLIHIRLD